MTAPFRSIQRLWGKSSSRQKRLVLVSLVLAFVLAFSSLAVANPHLVQAGLTQLRQFFGITQATHSSLDGFAYLEQSGISITDIAAGSNSHHTLAIDDEGTLWAWGANSYGQLGIPANSHANNPIFGPIDGSPRTRNEPVPQRVTGGASSWVDVETSTRHSLALDTDGNIWAWGQNAFGQLGLSGAAIGPDVFVEEPQMITTNQGRWASVEIGASFALALDIDGNLWSWGSNAGRVLGLGLADPSEIASIPVMITGGPDTWTQVAAGSQHALGLDEDGHLWAWGNNGQGRLGNNDNTVLNHLAEPTPIIFGPSQWALVSAGGDHSLGIDLNGNLYSWGWGSQGRLGQGDDNNRLVPTRVGEGADDWVWVSAGNAHTIAIDSSGNMWTWGWGQFGRPGQGGPPNGFNAPNVFAPQLVEGAADTWIFAEAAGNHSYALDVAGNIWTWGQTWAGGTGKGTFAGLESVPEEDRVPAMGGRLLEPDDWRPWRMAPSLIPRSNVAWQSPADATAPSDGATGVVITDSSTVQLRFDREMNPAESALGSIQIESSDGVVQTAVATGFSGIFNLRGASPSYMHAHEWTFETAPLFGVVSTAPESPLDLEQETLEVVFSQAVDLASLGTVTINGASVNLGAATWRAGNTILDLPLPELAPGTRYDVVVSDFVSVTGAVGGELSVDVSLGTWTSSVWGPNTVFSAPIATTPLALYFYTADGDVPPARDELDIVKVLTMPEGTTTPATTFIFDIVPHSVNSDTARAGELPLLNVPVMGERRSTQSITFSPSDVGTMTAYGSIEVTRTSASLTDGVVFPDAGMMAFRITERSDTFDQAADPDGTMTFDSRQWQVSFLIGRNAEPLTGTRIVDIHIQEVTIGDGGEEVLGPKLDELVFENEFYRTFDLDPTDSDSEALRISKAITGDWEHANLSQYFDFDLILTSPDMVTTPGGYRAYVVDTLTNEVVTAATNGTIAGVSSDGAYLLFASGVQQRVSLQHGQTLVFVNTHVGTTYAAVERGVDLFTPSAILTVNGELMPTLSAGEGEDLPTGERLIGEEANLAAFSNAYRFVPLTGLNIAVEPLLPFVVAAVALLALLISKRRRSSVEPPRM